MKNRSEKNVCEENTFNELFRQHSKDLYQFLYYQFGADNNPQDLVQEAFIKLWDNCRSVLPEKARAFLFTVARNKMLNELSKKKTALHYRQQVSEQVDNESPEFVMEENEYMQRLQQALEELSEEHRVTFLLNRVEGKKHREIAEMLGISQKAVEKRIYTALAILKKKLGNI